jgi:hypothetical protein
MNLIKFHAKIEREIFHLCRYFDPLIKKKPYNYLYLGKTYHKSLFPKLFGMWIKKSAKLFKTWGTFLFQSSN